VRATRTRIGATLLLASASLLANPVQSLDPIRDAARSAARAALAPIGGAISIDAVLLDSRLRLAACDQALLARVEGAANARLIVRVACQAPAAWSVRVPVQAQAIRTVVIAAQPIARNAIVTVADLRSELRDVLALPRGYYPDLDAVIGQQASRPIRAGAVLTPGTIAPARLVRRGDRVALTAGAGAIAVRSEGVALGDGVQGQRIKVRNIGSGRIIEGEVTAYHTVAAMP